MLENLGLVAGLALLIVRALRGVNIIFASLLSALLVALTITKLTHKEAYKDLFVVTVIVPVFATLAAMALAAIIY